MISHLSRFAAVALCLVSLGACTNMTDTQQRMVTGGAAGAAIGTVGTVMTGGCIPCGTAIGAAVGTGAGYVMEHMDKNTR